MDAFEALADPVRRTLLLAVRTGPVRVVDLAAAQPVSRPAVSRHLRQLLEAGLVRATDRGRERHYELAPAGLSVVQTLLDALRATPAPIREHHLDALETEVRRTTRDRRRRSATDDEHQETA